MTGSCAEPAERFADTFAKWALRGGVSAVGAGYEVANPPSLEDWGAPLAALSASSPRPALGRACSRRPSMPPATVTIWPVTCPAARSEHRKATERATSAARRPCAAPSWP